MRFALEKLSQTWHEILPLAEAHWNETKKYQGVPFNVDVKRYIAYNDMGCYLQFVARDEEKAVGYGGVYVMPSMHTGESMATEDTYYLSPPYRKGRNAILFFGFMENTLLSMGVKEVQLSTEVHNKTAERIIEYMGYEWIEKRWSKRLGAEYVRAKSA